MCIDNSKLKETNLGNGTLCRVRRVKIKDDAPPHATQWKNWEGKKVWCTSARHVEYIEFERFPDNERITALKLEIEAFKNSLDDGWERNSEIVSTLAKMQAKLDVQDKARRFKLSPTKCSASVRVALDDEVNERVQLKGVSITQIPVNCNDATTGHKLQGMSKDKLIVVNWSYEPNWIYVVLLSRVRTLNGLFLLRPLPEDCRY